MDLVHLYIQVLVAQNITLNLCGFVSRNIEKVGPQQKRNLKKQTVNFIFLDNRISE